ncbi:DUF1330 domain-containing protein [Streptomyces sp. NPDC057718]|uniref:DUF1330 domain-containing protein n=1 Tax=Streptomyces sp. NPDC057718 TaxID=3346225 RepID=UPI0036BE924B
MTAYAIAHLRPTDAPVEDEVLSYIERVQGTMKPYGGRFLVHGAEAEVVEGTWPDALVMIGFPGMAEAHAWYASPAYQEILPLRTRHLDGDVIIVPGVGPEYDASATAAAMRAARDRAAQEAEDRVQPVRSSDRAAR